MILYLIAGLIGVSNMILWGVYGDLLVEEFYLSKVLRSIFIGVIWSMYLFLLNPQLPALSVALAVISLERITTEIYKALIRIESQEKYRIPSDLNIKIHPKIKFVIGIFLFLLISLGLYFINISFIKPIYLTFITGLFVAVGGMLKDAPYEGFHSLKFLRSPTLAISVGLIIHILFPQLYGKYFLLAVGGGERIISEFYKKILLGRIPGKFKQKMLNKIWKKQRKKILFLYALNIMALIILYFI